MKVLNVELKMTIPNALSIFRLLLLPVFATLYLMSEKRPELLYWSFGVLVLSGVTESLDGLIARHFNQISDLGKMLDPLADKITQVVVVICLAMRFRELIPLVVICFLKELIQGLGGIFLLKKGAAVHGAKWYGKVSTFVFYGVMALIVLLPNMPFPLRVTLIALVIVLMLFSFVQYIRLFFGIKKAMPAGTDGEITAADSQKDSKSA